MSVVPFKTKMLFVHWNVFETMSASTETNMYLERIPEKELAKKLNSKSKYELKIENEIVEIESKRVEFIQMLSELSHWGLNYLEVAMWDAKESAERRKKGAWLRLLWVKYLIIRDAIEVKNGNEEEAWDFLS